jgi:pimeloyl-ACP methyl ester carboxylesterase
MLVAFHGTGVDMSTQGSYAKVNGLEMYYESHGPDSGPDSGPDAGSDAGSGLPLVLLHGGLQTIGLSFGAVLPTLAATRRVIAVELHGHGHTGDIERELTVPLLAQDVVALLDLLGVDRADLFGYSLGGMVALEAALRHPDRVGRVVLAAVAHRPEGYLDEIRDPGLHATSTRLPTQADFKEMTDAYDAVAPDPGHFTEFMAKCVVAAGYAGWAEDELRELAVPALLIVGDTDFVRIDHAERMRDLIPDAQLAVLPGCTHMGLMRRPELVLPMVRTFLAP